MSPLPEVGSASPLLAGESRLPAQAEESQRLNPLTRAGWDELVLAHPQASFFHSASWAGVLHDTYGHTPHYFCAMKGERLSAALPVMEVNSPLTGRRGVSLPFTDECLCLSDNSVSAQKLFREVLDFGRKRKWKYAECRGLRSFSDTTEPSLSFYGHTLDLADGGDKIFGRFDSGVRRAIRKAEGAKIQVELSRSLDGLLTYYSLHCKTRNKHGLPPQSLAFFRNIFHHVLAKDKGFIVVARHEDRPIAASMFFHFDDKAIYKFGASDLAFQHLRGNNLVMWEAIKWYASRGYASLNFGRTSIANEGLRRYKLGFGTAEYKIDCFKYDFHREAFVVDRDKVFGWFNGVFRLMPMPVSRMMGKLLYRHLS
jgi:hypothetical protein